MGNRACWGGACSSRGPYLPSPLPNPRCVGRTHGGSKPLHFIPHPLSSVQTVAAYQIALLGVWCRGGHSVGTAFDRDLLEVGFEHCWEAAA